VIPLNPAGGGGAPGPPPRHAPYPSRMRDRDYKRAHYGETLNLCPALPKLALSESVANTSTSNCPPPEIVSCPSKVLIFPAYCRGISCKISFPFVSRATT